MTDADVEWADAVAENFAPRAMKGFGLDYDALVVATLTLPLWLGTYFAWHVPPIYDTALEQSGWLLHLEHLTYFLAGVLMWWPVVHGRLRSSRWSVLLRLFLLQSVSEMVKTA